MKSSTSTPVFLMGTKSTAGNANGGITVAEKHWDKAVVQLPPKWTNSESATFDTRRKALRAEAVLYVIRRHLNEWVAEGTTVVDRDEVAKKLPAMSEQLTQHFYDIDHGDYDEGP